MDFHKRSDATVLYGDQDQLIYQHDRFVLNQYYNFFLNYSLSARSPLEKMSILKEQTSRNISDDHKPIPLIFVNSLITSSSEADLKIKI